jgi:hypothetical protein
MVDILCVRRNNRVHITGVTRKGNQWLADNTDPIVKLERPVDILDELIAEMKAAGLKVEDR